MTGDVSPEKLLAQLNEAQSIAHIGSWDWDISSDRVTWSDEMYRVFGSEPQSWDVSYEKLLDLVHPEDREHYQAVVQRAYDTLEPFCFEHRLILADGSIRTIEGRGRVVAEDGRPVRMFGTGQDVTESREAEVRLRASEQQVRSVVNSTDDAILSTDTSGLIQSWNRSAERIFGYTGEEAVGQSLTILIPERLRVRHQEGMRRVVERPGVDSFATRMETVGLHRDGSEFPMELSLSTWQTGEATYFTAVARDITERVLTEQELRSAKDAAESANQAKTAFLAAMSHELRTPLNAIIGFSELLLSPPAESMEAGDLYSFSRHIHESGMHLLHLINDILDITRLEAGRLQLKVQRLVLEDAIRSSVGAVQAMAEARGVEVRLPARMDDVVVADPVRLRQILENLLSNAVKFTPAGGQVAVEVERMDDALRLTVSDTGIGIATDDQDRIFEPFQQVVSEDVPPPGTGLGLAITRQLVQAHGGRLSLHSTVGEGSRFTILLPQPVRSVVASAPASPV